jgi:hypothetical protein
MTVPIADPGATWDRRRRRIKEIAEATARGEGLSIAEVTRSLEERFGKRQP